MKKVIIITTGFPGNGARVSKLAKYLPRFGYEPIIITEKSRTDRARERAVARELEHHIRVYMTICMNKSPFRLFSKLFGSWNTAVFFEKLFFIPDLYITWTPSALLKGLRIIKNEKIEAVITSSPPESVHVTGFLLKKLSGVKWIVDCRDLWTTKLIVNKPVTKLHELIIKKMEKAVYGETDHIIANTRGNKEVYLEHFRIPEEKVTVITNGYDPEEIQGEGCRPDCRGEKELAIGYMGYFDKPGFPWKEFLLEVKKVSALHKARIRLNICGHVSRRATDFISEHGLREIVHLHGVLPHSDAVEKTRENDLLLVLLYETGYSKAIVPHKLYHYLVMGRPIIAIAEEDGEVAGIINATKTGSVVSAGKGNGIHDMLLDYYREWERSGIINHNPDLDEVRKYDSITLAESLSRTIGMVAER